MSRLVQKSPSVCSDLPLNSPDVSNKLRLLLRLLASSYGPTARLKQVHNNVGGSVVTSSASCVLLRAVSSSQPVVALIKTSVLNHVSRFADCGLFAAVLCLSLVEQASRCGLRTSLLTGANRRLLALCAAYLRRDDCGCKVRLDFRSSRHLVALARGVISSKPTCVLSEAESAHVSRLAAEAFLLTFPHGRTAAVHIEGRPVLESAVFPGLLLDVRDNICVGNTRDPLRVVLFSASLAGDLCDLGDGRFEAQRGVDAEAQILGQLLELGKQALEDGVKVFVCQKVIHPVLQQQLRLNGVMVIERLGVSLMEPLMELTGAQPVATLHTTIPSTAYGKVHNVSVRQFGSKTMLHLEPAGETAVCSMVLCHRNETMLNELKLVCQKAETVLRLTLREPCALHGGGCTETHLAAYLRHQSKEDVSEATSALGCSQTEYLLAADAFCRCLESVAAFLEHDGRVSLVDLTHAHHWTLPSDVTEEHLEGVAAACGCGVLRSCQNKKWSYLNSKYEPFSPAPPMRDSPLQPTVLDSFTAKVNALGVAVETANVVLDVRYMIQDVN